MYGKMICIYLLTLSISLSFIRSVVVCNKCDTCAKSKGDALLEGRTLADAWGAKFYGCCCKARSVKLPSTAAASSDVELTDVVDIFHQVKFYLSYNMKYIQYAVFLYVS